MNLVRRIVALPVRQPFAITQMCLFCWRYCSLHFVFIYLCFQEGDQRAFADGRQLYGQFPYAQIFFFCLVNATTKYIRLTYHRLVLIWLDLSGYPLVPVCAELNNRDWDLSSFDTSNCCDHVDHKNGKQNVTSSQKLASTHASPVSSASMLREAKPVPAGSSLTLGWTWFQLLYVNIVYALRFTYLATCILIINNIRIDILNLWKEST